MAAGMMRSVGVAVAALLALPCVAPAAQVDAVPRDRFSGDVAMAQGESLTLRNVDVASHNVSSAVRDGDGRPLFASKTIGPNQSTPVAGVEHLVTGSYAFVCTLHPGMQATLRVTAEGTPKPRPGATPGSVGQADGWPPDLTVRVPRRTLTSMRRLGTMAVFVRVDEPSRLTVRVRAARRVLARRAFDAPAGDRVVAVPVLPDAATLLRRPRLLVSVAAVAVDPAGNEARAAASRTLRRR